MPSQALEAHFKEIEAAVSNLRTSDQWFEMLAVAARFPDYSAGNVFSIFIQRPDATMVMPYGDRKHPNRYGWLSVGRQVRLGEHGIKILAPVRKWVNEVDDQTGQERRVKKVVGFRVANTFDVSQTEGKELPDVGPKPLEGDAPKELWQAVVRELDDLGWRVKIENPYHPTANGESAPQDKTVHVRPELSPMQQLKTLLHEKHHVALGHTDDYDLYVQHRGTMESEAESASFVVMRALDLDSSGYSVPYVASWCDDPKELRLLAGRVIEAARTTLEGIENFRLASPALDIEVEQSLGAEMGVA